MNMTSVTSSNLEAVGYDASSKTLRIRFHNGTYDYYAVPSNVHQSLMNAESKGTYHDLYIKKGGYRYARV